MIIPKVRGYPGNQGQRMSFVKFCASVISEEVLPFPKTMESRWIPGLAISLVGRKAAVQGSYQSQPDTEPTITGCKNLVSIREPQFLLCKMCKSSADISSGCEYSIS